MFIFIRSAKLFTFVNAARKSKKGADHLCSATHLHKYQTTCPYLWIHRTRHIILITDCEVRVNIWWRTTVYGDEYPRHRILPFSICCFRDIVHVENFDSGRLLALLTLRETRGWPTREPFSSLPVVQHTRLFFTSESLSMRHAATVWNVVLSIACAETRIRADDSRPLENRFPQVFSHLDTSWEHILFS